MVLVGGLALALAGSPPMLAAPKLRTAVIAVSPDHVEAGALQRELETSLANVPGIELVTSALAGPALAVAGGDPVVPPPDPAQKSEWERRFTEVEGLYLRDELDLALKELAAIDRVQAETRWVPAAERARLLLWRATIHLAQGDTSTAEQRVRSALALDPSQQIDAAVFPPSVRKLAAGVTAEGFRRVRLTITGAPPGHVVLVDGRRPDPAGVPVGSHVIAVGAPGFRWVELPAQELRADTSVDVPLPLAPPPAIEPTLRDMAMGGTETVPETRVLQELAATLGADALVLATHVSRKGDAKAASPADPCAVEEDARERRITGVFWRRAWSRSLAAPPRPYPDDKNGRQAFARWLDGTLSDASRGTLASLGLTATASTGYAFRDERVWVEGSEGYRTRYGGLALGASAGIAPGRWLLRTDGFLNLYGLNGVVVRPEGVEPDDDGPRNQREVGGGQLVGGTLSAGRRFLVKGDDFRSGWWWSIEAVGLFEKLHRRDIEDSVGPLGFFPSHDRLVLGARVKGVAPVPRTPLAVEASTFLMPYTQWRETPDGTTGRRPAADPRGSAEVLVRWMKPRSVLRYAGVLQIDSASVEFDGRARPPVAPAMFEARRDEVQFNVLVRAEWSP